MIEAFEKLKDIDHPIVMHINTIKGKGYEIAEKRPRKIGTGHFLLIERQESLKLNGAMSQNIAI